MKSWLRNKLLRLYRRFLERQIDFNRFDPVLSEKIDAATILLGE